MLTRHDGVMPGGVPFALWVIDARPGRSVPAAVLAIGGRTLLAAPIDGRADAVQMADLGAALGLALRYHREERARVEDALDLRWDRARDAADGGGER